MHPKIKMKTPAEVRGYEIVSTPHQNKNRFNYHSRPMIPLQLKDVADLEIRSLEISPKGRAGGVIFIETCSGSFVLKPCHQCPSEYFYNELGAMLGLNVPGMRVLSCYDKNFEELVFNIEKYCQEDEVLYSRLKVKLDFPFYELIEYIPSISIALLGRKKFEFYMLEDHKLYSMGMCLAYDMIINNNDRFELIWRGSGNIENVLICFEEIADKSALARARDPGDMSVKLGDYVFIDHDGNMIDKDERIAADNLDKYMTKAANFQLELIRFLLKEVTLLPAEFDKLTEQLRLYTGYQLTEHNALHIAEGIVYLTALFLDAFEDGEIKQLHESLLRSTSSQNQNINYWNQFWNQEFKRVHYSFCEVYHVKIKSIYSIYPELIQQVHAKVDQVMQDRQRTSTVMSSVDREGERQFQISEESSLRVSDHDQPQNSQTDKVIEESGSQKSEQRSNLKSGKQSSLKNGQQEQQVDDGMQRRRRWKEKLQVFENQNYRP